MGLRIIKKNAAIPPEEMQKMRDRMLEAEAVRWSDLKIGDVDKLRSDFLNKMREIRAQYPNAHGLSLVIDQITMSMRQRPADALNAQKAIDHNNLLDLV